MKLLGLAVCALAPGPFMPHSLAGLLTALNVAAPGIRSVEAKATLADYTALVSDTTTSTGTLYFERSPQGPRYALVLTQPADLAKTFLYRDQAAWLYVPAANQVQEFKLGAQQQMLNQFLLLGMGASGSELQASFDLVYDGAASLDGHDTAKLTLTPRAAAAAARFPKIEIWYDPRTWIAEQVQLWQPGGDYHLVRYSHLELNRRVDARRFSTAFPGATVVVAKP